MGSIALRRAVLVFMFLIISASIFSTSSAGKTRKFMSYPEETLGAVNKEVPFSFAHGGEDTGVHQRMLKVQTNDYGSYDPSPAFVKPPFKLIPN